MLNTALNTPFDGFTLNPAIRFLPYHFTPMALGQLDTLRRANRYRMKIHALPDDFNQPLAAYETQEFQVQVSAGTYLWGVLFNQFNSSWVKVAPSGILWQVTEACNGLQLNSDFCGGQGWTGFMTTPPNAGGSLPHLLVQPKLFLEPGNIAVELSNIGTTTTRMQLLLFFAEPCVVIEEGEGRWSR
jgi:hypothetical protein